MKQKSMYVLLALTCAAALAYWLLGGVGSSEVEIEANPQAIEVRALMNGLVQQEENSHGGP